MEQLASGKQKTLYNMKDAIINNDQLAEEAFAEPTLEKPAITIEGLDDLNLIFLAPETEPKSTMEKLNNVRVAILSEDGFEEVELTSPKKR